MSDEPKKHTRAWFLWAMIALVLVAYLRARTRWLARLPILWGPERGAQRDLCPGRVAVRAFRLCALCGRLVHRLVVVKLPCQTPKTRFQQALPLSATAPRLIRPQFVQELFSQRELAFAPPGGAIGQRANQTVQQKSRPSPSYMTIRTRRASHSIVHLSQGRTRPAFQANRNKARNLHVRLQVSGRLVAGSSHMNPDAPKK
jgi:hypothetical protein